MGRNKKPSHRNKIKIPRNDFQTPGAKNGLGISLDMSIYYHALLIC
jgi:hypothetical protein